MDWAGRSGHRARGLSDGGWRAAFLSGWLGRRRQIEAWSGIRPVPFSCPQSRLAAPDEELPYDELNKWRSTHRWSPNRLRHTAATEARKRYGLDAAQAILEHADAGVTQIYAERDWALAERVAREVG